VIQKREAKWEKKRERGQADKARDEKAGGCKY
jgi:hypothetical protein